MLARESPIQVISSPPETLTNDLGRCMDVSNITLPDDFDLWNSPIENQGNIGNCVAQAIAGIHEVYRHIHFPSLPHQDFSVGFIYGLENRYAVGMMPCETCDQVIEYGDVLRSDFECLKENPECYNEVQAKREELEPKAIRFFYKRLSLSNIDSIRRFIFRYRVPIMLIIKSGTHAVYCGSWKKINGEINLQYVNSWGADWSKDGKQETTIFQEGWGLVPMSTVVNFPDVPEDHWAYKEIQEAVADGIMMGLEDGTFGEDKPLTRSQMAMMYSRMKKMGLFQNDL